MVRSFRPEPVEPALVDRMLELARRAPSAGNSQGFEAVVLEGREQTARFWDATLPADRRAGFRFPGLLAAPLIVLPLADPGAYVRRYGEADKAATGLGAGTDAWPVPYWTVDASFAVMTLLLAATDAGLGALFFAVFRGAEAVRSEFAIPADRQLLGAVALGHPADDDAPGRSASRPRRPLDRVVHRGGWTAR